MFIRTYAAVIVTSMTLFSCGLETSEEDSFKDKSKDRVDTSADKGDANATKKTSKSEQNSGDDLDCSGISLHGIHLSCDKDDVAAKDEKTTDTTEDKTDTPDDKPVDKPDDKPADKPDDKPVDNTPPKDPNIVEFRIKAGTANGAWNTQAEMITAKIGQTIRIINDDTITHRMHTGNNAPCPHGANIAPGASANCVVGRAVDTTNSNTVYDHIVGTSAKIWIKAD